MMNICELLNIRYPILLGGMARVGTWELAAAVSEAGGLGTIGSGDAPPHWLKEQIRRLREKTDKPFAVNLMMMSPFFKENLEVLFSEKVKVVAFGGGNPGAYVTALKQAGLTVIPVVSSVALARRLERQGADILVAEGMESGGHVGKTTTISLVPQVVNSVKIPVVAAGGIANGRGLVAALALGAQGVQIGTRFVCSSECIAHPNYKAQIIAAGDRATVVTGSSTGHPVRCLENKFTREFTALEKTTRPVTELEELGRGRLSLGVMEGDIERGSLMAGQISGLINVIKPVGEIIEEIISEAETLLKNFSTLRLR